MKPMLAGSVDARDIDVLLGDDQWLVQQKLDGDRLLIEVADGKVTALNRNGEIRRNMVPATVLRQFSRMTGNWLFDGELLDELWLFDLPVANGFVSPGHPYGFRLAVLERFFAGWHPDPCVRLLPTARDRTNKLHLAEAVLAGNGEGLMFKALDAPYRPGKRSARMLKAKFDKTCDCVVTRISPDGRDNCACSLFRNGQLIEVATIGLAGKPAVRVGDVVEVRYLYASDDDRLYQPRMLRVRDDKSPVECTFDQLVYTSREVIEVPTIPPYVRQQRHCRATGTTISVCDASHPDSAFTVTDGRWVTSCVDHGFAEHYRTLREARANAAHPEKFCPACGLVRSEHASS